MPLPPRVIYLLAVAILIAAGSLLSTRTVPDQVPQGLSADCTTVAAATVAELFPGGVATTEATGGPDVRYGRWLDDDGEVLLEVRCATLTHVDVRSQRDAVQQARDGDALRLLDTEPAATLDVTSAGTVIRQVDEEAGLSRTWFVARSLDPVQGETLVEATRRAGTSAV